MNSFPIQFIFLLLFIIQFNIRVTCFIVVFHLLNSFNKDTLVVRAVRDIAEGEEVFNCYGNHTSILITSYIKN